MKLFFEIAIMSLTMAFAQAEPAYEGNKAVCTSSDMLNKSHLSCIACGLKKIGRPVPDDHYLALMGLISRESTSLFPDEVNPSYKKQGRRSLAANQSQIVEKANGPVELTARAQLQKNVIQLLLSSGYCTQGKIQPKLTKAKNSKNEQIEADYKNFIERMNSDKFAVTSENKKIRQKAVQEIGYSDWENAKFEFFMDSTPSFFTLSFDMQKEFYKRKRTSALQRDQDDGGYRPKNELTECLTDIDNNYAKTYSSVADSYAACTAIYDECGIATNPNDNNALYRKDANGNNLRVGGDWCSSKFPVPQPVIAKDGKASTVAPKDIPKLRDDGTPYAPIEDKSFRSLGEVFQQGDQIVGPEGTIDTSKVQYGPNGIFIPTEAIKLKQPASLPAGTPPVKRPAVDVQGAPKATK